MHSHSFTPPVLDPHFKDRIFEKLIGSVFQSDWVTLCTSQLWSTLEIEYSDDNVTQCAAAAELSVETTSNPFVKASETMLGSSARTSVIESSELQLWRYLSEDCAPIMLDPLYWWRANETQFPTVAKMARVFLAIPGMLSMHHAYPI